MLVKVPREAQSQCKWYMGNGDYVPGVGDDIEMLPDSQFWDSKFPQHAGSIYSERTWSC